MSAAGQSRHKPVGRQFGYDPERTIGNQVFCDAEQSRSRVLVALIMRGVQRGARRVHGHLRHFRRRTYLRKGLLPIVGGRPAPRFAGE